MEGRTVCFTVLILLCLHFECATCPGVPSAFLIRKNFYFPITEEAVSPPPSLPPKSHCYTVVCAPSPSVRATVFPWISCFISVVLLLVPAIRVKRLQPNDRGGAHTLFCWFLSVGCVDYLLWIIYSSDCRLHHSTFPILVTSGAGLLIHLLLVMVATCRTLAVNDPRLVFLVILLIIAVAGWRFPHSPIIGWFALGAAAVSHLCKIGATDHSNFDCILFGASILGTVNGLVWLAHPDMCIAKQYKISSFVIAVLSGADCFLWYKDTIVNCWTRLEGTEASMSVELGRLA